MLTWKGSRTRISHKISSAGMDYACFHLCCNNLDWFMFLSPFRFGPVWLATTVWLNIIKLNTSMC